MGLAIGIYVVQMILIGHQGLEHGTHLLVCSFYPQIDVYTLLFPLDCEILEGKDGHFHIFISPKATSVVPQTWKVLIIIC